MQSIEHAAYVVPISYAGTRHSERFKYKLLADKIEELLHKKVQPSKLKNRRLALESLADEYEKDGSGSDVDIVTSAAESTAAISSDPIARLHPQLKVIGTNLGRLAACGEHIEKLLGSLHHKSNVRIVKAATLSHDEMETMKMSKTDRNKMVAAGKRLEKEARRKVAANTKKAGSVKRMKKKVEEEEEEVYEEDDKYRYMMEDEDDNDEDDDQDNDEDDDEEDDGDDDDDAVDEEEEVVLTKPTRRRAQRKTY
ncbi:hypothetical protein BCR33DRAFT_792178 [Rhizoclosmatium globosum]|uniref:Uncharacterized protein n=1 Tax=Rhizoclosmatium globosum TaxID=329046 RepID=A0A1Y2B9S0_9FUNG|nr:hypothetical protein BCR33DRAFT_792178 [Rhizoclosmatium globosum]|eukprot:ORY31579.1 hypothetical protein BCR33DRAFT_792178 [Rhizoclosmatium globosum]